MTGGGGSAPGPAPGCPGRTGFWQQPADTPLLQGGMTPVRTEQYPSSASRGLSATWSAVWVTVTVQSAQDVGGRRHYGAHLRTVHARRGAEGRPFSSPRPRGGRSAPPAPMDDRPGPAGGVRGGGEPRDFGGGSIVVQNLEKVPAVRLMTRCCGGDLDQRPAQEARTLLADVAPSDMTRAGSFSRRQARP